MKKKAYQFYNDVYFQSFFFVPNWTREDMIKSFHIDLEDNAHGAVFATPDGIFIWIREFNLQNMGVLTHEAIHAANCMFIQKGVRISAKNDEAQTYMVQWIFDRCMKHLKKTK